MNQVLDVMTPLGFRVRCTAERWALIAEVKHPPMRDGLDDVRVTLSDPDEIRRSVQSIEVMLFHRRIEPRWVCAVVRRADGAGFLITAYPADRIKQGDVLWKK